VKGRARGVKWRLEQGDWTLGFDAVLGLLCLIGCDCVWREGGEEKREKKKLERTRRARPRRDSLKFRDFSPQSTLEWRGTTCSLIQNGTQRCRGGGGGGAGVF